MAMIVLDLNIQGLNLTNYEIVLKMNGHVIKTLSNFDSQLCLPSPEGFCQFIEKEIQNLILLQRIRSAEIHKCVLRQFSLFRNGVDITFEKLNSEEIKKFESFLKNRKLSLNTISFYMRVLRSCYNKALEKYLFTDQQPFKHVYTGIETTDKRALDFDTIKSIKECQLSDSEECFARDLFMFSFYTRGMSFVDMAYLKRSNIKQGLLHYKRHKNGRGITIKWEQCMQDIVDKHKNTSSEYLLPIIHLNNGKERNQYRGVQSKVNKSLKEIARKCGIECNLTMYVARHSWANAANTLNPPLELISYGMGHTSTKTTKIYLNTIEMSRIDELNTAIIQELHDV